LFIRKCNENAKQNLSVTPIWTTVANYGWNLENRKQHGPQAAENIITKIFKLNF
jgi:hypothetical protein